MGNLLSDFTRHFDILLGTEHSIVLIVSLLNSLMRDQIVKLKDPGISACMIQGQGVLVEDDASANGSTKLLLDKLVKPAFQLLYMHPEVCVDDKKIVRLFNSPIYQERVICVLVDEAHLVLNW